MGIRPDAVRPPCAANITAALTLDVDAIRVA